MLVAVEVELLLLSLGEIGRDVEASGQKPDESGGEGEVGGGAGENRRVLGIRFMEFVSLRHFSAAKTTDRKLTPEFAPRNALRSWSGRGPS